MEEFIGDVSAEMQEDPNHMCEIEHVKHEDVTDQKSSTDYDYVFKVITIGDPGKLFYSPLSGV